MIIIFQVFAVPEASSAPRRAAEKPSQNGRHSALCSWARSEETPEWDSTTWSYAGCKSSTYDSKRATPDFTMTIVPCRSLRARRQRFPDKFTVITDGRPVANPSHAFGEHEQYAQRSRPFALTNHRFSPRGTCRAAGTRSLKNCSLMEGPINGSNVFRTTLTEDYLLRGNLPMRSRLQQPGGLGVFYAGVGPQPAT